MGRNKNLGEATKVLACSVLVSVFYLLSFFLFLNEQGMAFGIRRTFACLDFSGGGLAVPTTRGSFQARD